MIPPQKMGIIWAWIRKIKWYLLGLGTLAIASVFLGASDTTIPPIVVDGKTIVFAYTDSTEGEKLLIKTDRANCVELFGCEFYAAIKNISGETQSIDFSFLFQNEAARVEKIEVLIPTQRAVIVKDYSSQCQDKSFISTTTGQTITRQICKDVIVGEHTELVPHTIVQEVKSESANRAIAGFTAREKIKFDLPNNAVRYARLTLRFPPNTAGQFLLSADSPGARGVLE